MIVFWIVAAAMLAAVLIALLWPLLRRRRNDAELAGTAERCRAALRELDRMLTAGEIDESEADKRRNELSRQLLDAVGQEPERERRPTSSLAGAAVLAIATPVLAIVMYQYIGTPGALTETGAGSGAASQMAARSGAGAAQGEQAPGMQRAVDQLRQRLERQPDDVQGWMLLGRAYREMGRLQEAEQAFARAFELAPEDPRVLVTYAEALVYASDGRSLQGRPSELVERALEIAPEHQKGLWLSGIAAYQRRDFQRAVARWRKLLGVIPEGEQEIRQTVERQIAQARRQMGEDVPEPASSPAVAGGGQPAAPAAPATGGSSATESSASEPTLPVNVSLAPELSSRINGNETVFVFARAANGPPMPLAVRRLRASELPVSLTLGVDDAMTPARSLATAERVFVVARVSRSGGVQAQPGDLEARVGPMANAAEEPVALKIDRVIGQDGSGS